jgi:uncharacterized RDD family membrane protein YckC
MSPAKVSPIPKEAREYQGLRAGLITRMIAAVIDGLVVAAVMLAGYVGIAGTKFLINPSGFSAPSGSWLLSFTLAFCVAVLYLTVGWAVSGRSYGDHVLGLRVVNYRGRRLRLPTAFARALFCVAFPAGLLWCAASRANRSVQDVVLRSSVVYDWEPGSPWRHLAAPESAAEATAQAEADDAAEAAAAASATGETAGLKAAERDDAT